MPFILVPPAQSQSIQDTFLSNFDFLHYTQILHYLKDQWWAFCPPLWASGPILHASVGPDDLGGCGETFLFYDFFLSCIFCPPGVKKVVFWPFFDTFQPFWRTSWLKRKKMYKMKKLPHLDTYLECDLCFLIFSQQGLQNGHWRHLKVACTF